MNETRMQNGLRRMKMGLHNPKHDFWARRGRRMQDILSNPATQLRNIVAKLKWWQRIYVAIVLLFKRIWRNLFGKTRQGD
jgi:hypothetical protein